MVPAPKISQRRVFKKCLLARAENRTAISAASTCVSSTSCRLKRTCTYESRTRLESCSRDPIGYEGSEWNLYEYVQGSPALLVDPSGMVPPWDGPLHPECGRFPGDWDCDAEPSRPLDGGHIMVLTLIAVRVCGPAVVPIAGKCGPKCKTVWKRVWKKKPKKYVYDCPKNIRVLQPINWTDPDGDTGTFERMMTCTLTPPNVTKSTPGPCIYKCPDGSLRTRPSTPRPIR